MDDSDLREPGEMFWNSPLKWVVPILYAIVLGFLFYGLKQMEENNKAKIEQRQLEKRP